MTTLLEGKVSLVTGAGRGIGRGVALAMAREGASVVVADILSEGAEQTVALIESDGGRATAVTGDVSRPEAVRGWVDTAEERYGRLDCAVNNAGIPNSTVGAANLLLADWPDVAFDRMIEVNLKSVWLCMRDEINAMLRHGQGGVIVNVSSIAGLIALPTSGAYATAKHGVIGLTRVGAIDYGTRGIRVNAVCPGFTETDILRPHMAERGDEINRRIPAGRVGSVEEIAEMAVWLCSDRASYVTGQAIAVDGGYVAQ
jgi:NAD(P)-dependent dehydrogenase (short-subunit alcohol dehydrogenase family)